VSGQQTFAVDDCPEDVSVGELMPQLLEQMSLPRMDVSGNPLTHTLRRDSDGAVLNGSDVIGEVLQPGERVVVQPSIDAGSGG
jgi:hypothetical protein